MLNLTWMLSLLLLNEQTQTNWSSANAEKLHNAPYHLEIFLS